MVELRDEAIKFARRGKDPPEIGKSTQSSFAPERDPFAGPQTHPYPKRKILVSCPHTPLCAKGPPCSKSHQTGYSDTATMNWSYQNVKSISITNWLMQQIFFTLPSTSIVQDFHFYSVPHCNSWVLDSIPTPAFLLQVYKLLEIAGGKNGRLEFQNNLLECGILRVCQSVLAKHHSKEFNDGKHNAYLQVLKEPLEIISSVV